MLIWYNFKRGIKLPVYHLMIAEKSPNITIPAET